MFDTIAAFRLVRPGVWRESPNARAGAARGLPRFGGEPSCTVRSRPGEPT